MEKETTTHESFGQIRFSRVSGGQNYFYGSELPQNNYITLEILSSEFERDLCGDTFYPKEQIIKVRLSNNQFSELITSLNISSGVCCTIERKDNKKVEPFPEIENRKDFVHNLLELRLKDFNKKMNESKKRANQLISKKTLSEKDKTELKILLDVMVQEIHSNIPYFVKCFHEATDNIVKEAKMEIENAIQHKVYVAGLETLLKNNQLSLSDNSQNED